MKIEYPETVPIADDKKWINKLIGVRALTEARTVSHETIQFSSGADKVQLQQ